VSASENDTTVSLRHEDTILTAGCVTRGIVEGESVARPKDHKVDKPVLRMGMQERSTT
jgi:hypothetical protein